MGGAGVSIHAPAGGATLQIGASARLLDVSIHAPAGGATRPSSDNLEGFRFQFTLPRGERHDGSAEAAAGLRVSIHAPAGGATGGAGWRPPAAPCFNSRSRGGSDTTLFSTSNSCALFQFTLPRGERLVIAAAKLFVLLVSIHAPAGGATEKTLRAVISLPCFNSRSRGGSDASRHLRMSVVRSFQFTLPRGERRARRRPATAPSSSFQFTLPRGERRPCAVRSGAWPGVSIHAPAGGATRFRSKRVKAFSARFNSRSRGGSDRDAA